jgi:protease IV
MGKRSVLLGFLIGAFVILIFFGLSILVLTQAPEMAAHAFNSGDNIGLIEIVSTITVSQPYIEQLKKYREDKSVRAILLRIDSPGGGVGPSQEIYSEIMKTRVTKPVVASLGGTAASGGYYIACAANMIYANPGTLTGSIGAIMEFLNLQGLYQWAGVSADTIKSGMHKDMGSWTRQLSTEERDLLQKLVDEVLAQFITAISNARNIPPDRIIPIADGRVFTGEQALSYGLVDRLGNFNDALDAAAELGQITGKPNIVRMREKKIDFFDKFFDYVGEEFQGRLEEILEKTFSRTFSRLHY